MRQATGFLALAIGCALPFACLAQAWPAKPIQIVSDNNVGSIGDTALRLAAVKMAEGLGQQVVIENRAGAQGAIAAAVVKKAAPDGYTTFYGASSGMVIARFFLKNKPYDSLKDFAPISAVVSTASFLVVNADLPAHSVKELAEYARRNPGKLLYGSTGIGSPFHLYGEALKAASGTDITHVPYNTGNAGIMVNDLIAGRLQVYFMSYSILRGQLKNPKVRPLAAIGTERFKRHPEIPAITEELPAYQVAPSIYAWFGPLGLPQPVAARLSAEARKALGNPEVFAKLDELGIIPVGSTPEGLTALLLSSIDTVGKIAKAIGVEPE